ncbi:PBP1A family penicillin-binding protein [bacterium]|nr:MAG: PBP1A family penicillin-binding protein [bacterium]
MKKVIIKNSKRSQKTQKNRGKKLYRALKYLIGAFFVLSLLGLLCSVAGFAYFAKDLPDPNKLLEREPIESTKIFDRTGEHLLYEIHGEQKRTMIDINELPDYIKNAVVAIEDDKFYTHHGIDIMGILRAAYRNVINGSRGQGGSTITQQLVKNAILTKEKTYSRKIKEAILSIEIERKFSKDDILQMYLNEIPYGSNVYGIEAASQHFFGKPAKDLTISETATLSSLPKATTYYSPYGTHTDSLETRRLLVLDKMKEFQYITEEEYMQAIEEKPVFSELGQGIFAPHFVMYIKEQLVDQFGENEVEQGGLKIYTTLDWDKQQIAEEAVRVGAENNEIKYGAKNSALIAIDPKTGEILSMVGSRDYFDLENDGNVNVTLSLRQPGSSFKPFAYLTAFQKGYTPETVLFDVETDFNEYIPHNYDDTYIGPITMRSALQLSKNVVSVKTLYLAGERETFNLAKKLGISSLTDHERYGLSLVLGGGEVRLLEIVSAYGVMANDGIKNPVVSVLKIEDRYGDIIFEANNSPQRVLDPQHARMISDVLSDNVARTPAFGAWSKLYLGNRPAAAKTGTTNDARDAWTIGYTPSLAAGVWSGNNNNTPMKGRAGGSSAAAPIWNDFMKKALEGTVVENFTKPEIIENSNPVLSGTIEDPTIYRIDSISKKLATEFTPEYLIEEKTLKRVHCILHYINKDNPNDPPPENPADDSQYESWENAVQVWGIENEYIEEIPEEYDDVHTVENQPNITITNPRNGQSVNAGSNILLSADTYSKLKPKEINIFLDGQLIQSISNFPLSTDFQIPTSTSNGSHTIKTVIFDTVYNSAEDEVDINVSGSTVSDNQISQQNFSVSLSFPQEIVFPLDATIIVSSDEEIDPDEIFTVRLINNQTKEILGSSSIPNLSPKNEFKKYFNIRIPQTLNSGTYYFYTQALLSQGRIVDSSVLKVGL